VGFIDAGIGWWLHPWPILTGNIWANDDKPWDGSWGSKIWGPSPSMMETTHGPRGPGGPGPRSSLALESKRGAQLGRPTGMGLSGSVGVKVTLWLWHSQFAMAFWWP
jgi:hypothetical protein